MHSEQLSYTCKVLVYILLTRPSIYITDPYSLGSRLKEKGATSNCISLNVVSRFEMVNLKSTAVWNCSSNRHEACTLQSYIISPSPQSDTRLLQFSLQASRPHAQRAIRSV